MTTAFVFPCGVEVRGGGRRIFLSLIYCLLFKKHSILLLLLLHSCYTTHYVLSISLTLSFAQVQSKKIGILLLLLHLSSVVLCFFVFCPPSHINHDIITIIPQKADHNNRLKKRLTQLSVSCLRCTHTSALSPITTLLRAANDCCSLLCFLSLLLLFKEEDRKILPIAYLSIFMCCNKRHIQYLACYHLVLAVFCS